VTIVPAESKATYEINEKLQGKPVHVVGTTQAISGTAQVDVTAPVKVQIGEIKLDATTFKTDIAKRDENVSELVLKSTKPEFKYITFVPTMISGVPANVEKGKDFPVTIVGDMTILGVKKSVAFTGTMNIGSDNSLTVKAKTKLTYGDFGVTIPNFSFLSDIDKTVDLSVELVAR
jgi:polyisoprenoid-binding protein YceI